jgi:hypothetical protein
MGTRIGGRITLQTLILGTEWSGFYLFSSYQQIYRRIYWVHWIALDAWYECFRRPCLVSVIILDHNNSNTIQPSLILSITGVNLPK